MSSSLRLGAVSFTEVVQCLGTFLSGCIDEIFMATPLLHKNLFFPVSVLLTGVDFEIKAFTLVILLSKVADLFKLNFSFSDPQLTFAP